MAGNGAIKLDATMFALLTLRLRVSVMSTLTCVVGEPGLDTETTLKPSVLGSVTPAKDWLCDAVPPLALMFVKLYDKMVESVTVLTRSIDILRATGQ